MPKNYRFPDNLLPILTLYVLGVGMLNSCATTEKDKLQQALDSDHPAIRTVMQNPKKFELQIIFTEIDQINGGNYIFTDHTFQLNSLQYFYPASTVKLPAAILALEQLQNFPEIDANTPYFIAGDSLSHTVADDLRQIFAVSDNEAFNRLYEFLGRDVMNEQLRQKRITPVQISHRLSTPNASEASHLPLQFVLGKDTLQFIAPAATQITPLTMAGTSKGKGYMNNDSLISRPMDFSEKNFFPIKAQHDLMKRLFFASEYDKSERFHLSEENKQLLLHHMPLVPRKNGYEESTYYDGYGKFFMYGDAKERIPDHITIYNKVGYAYGTLTETAYIHDVLNDIQFMLTATILVNENGIFNDDTYEFDTIGIPFLAQLGRELYQQELNNP